VARSKKAKQWTGVLAEPIADDVGTLAPQRYPVGSPEAEEWIGRRARHMSRLQIQMLPELARQLGMKVHKFDLTTTDGLTVFLTDLVLRLALKLEIPSFMLPKSKWPRQIVYWALLDGDARRAHRERDPDLTSCLGFVQLLDSKLKRNKSAAIRRAKTLRNEVSKMRRTFKAQAEAHRRRISKNARSATLSDH
jgi:hypothetical protein